MSLFRKFFGTSSEEEDNDRKQEVKSPYSPDTTLPIDEQFTFNFKENGGKFIYCTSMNEIHDNFENIFRSERRMDVWVNTHRQKIP